MAESKTPPPGAALPVPSPDGGHYPSQGQDIPDDQLAALVLHMPSGNFGWSPYELLCIGDVVRSAYRVGYAAALGYEIEVTDAGVAIGDRPEANEPAGGEWSPPNPVDRPVPDVWAGIRQRIDPPAVQP